MAFGGRTKSTAPEAMALRGMPSNFADCGASANVMPPSALIARSPSAPSDAPAEAPMPTIGKASLDGWGAATPPRAGKVARCSRVAFLIGEGGVDGRVPPLREGERGPRGDLFIAALRARRSARSNAITVPARG